MEIGSADLTEVVRSVRLLKINGYSMINNMGNGYCFSYKWIVDEYEWELRVYPCQRDYGTSFVTVRLFLLTEARHFIVSTILRFCLVDPTGMLKPSKEECRSWKFWRPEESCPQVVLMKTSELEASGYLKGDSFTVKCTLEFFKELSLSDIKTTPLKEPTSTLKELHPPSPNLHQHFAQLLQSETGADVTFLVSGESFAAHKLILAARSPVFMAEFFGDMKEKRSQRVEIEDMEAPVFKALLRFMYTDTVPEFMHQKEADVEAICTDTLPEFADVEADAEVAMVMAQHLLAAADRYGLDTLKLICATELSGGINVDTAATTLALAEQHSCAELKERCVEFIIRTSSTLDAVLLTEGYKHLEASCPLVVIELLRSARGRKK